MRRTTTDDRRWTALRFRSRESGLALLVIVGILTALFIMGATFALLMRAERRSGQNFAMSEAASRLARDNLTAAMQILTRVNAAAQSYSSDCYGDESAPGSPWTSQSDPNITITDEDSRFNLNAMGYPADLGSEADYRQRFLSFETSLVRVLMNVPAVWQTYKPRDRTYEEWYADRLTDDDYAHMRQVCIWIAREIAERRYGAPRSLTAADPTGLDTIPRPGEEHVNDMDLAHAWGWSISKEWDPANDDAGIEIPLGGTKFGEKDGYPSAFTTFDSPRRLATFDAEEHMWRGQNPANTWNDDAGTGYPATGADDDENRLVNLGWEDSAPSAICDQTGKLWVEPWVGAPRVVDDLGEYDPEAPLANDQAYASIYQIPAIIQYVLRNEYYENMNEDESWLRTTRLFNGFNDVDENGNRRDYPGIRDFITAHSHTRRAKAPNAAVTTNLVNLSSALADINSRPPEVADLIQDLADKLGLIDWAGDNADHRRQATQLVANIIDFADGRTDPADTSLDGDAPTQAELKFTNSDGSQSTYSAYGCEGLHITEIMAVPARKDATAGNGPAPRTTPSGWQWQGTYWQVVGPQPTAKTDRFTFTEIPAGWYAIRIFAYDKTQQLLAEPGVTFTWPTGSGNNYPVHCLRGSSPGNYYGYVRKATSHKLVAVQVDASHTLTFDLTGKKPAGGTGPNFVGIQLLPQYLTITNIAMQDPRLTGSHGISFKPANRNPFVLRVPGDTMREIALAAQDYYAAPYYDDWTSAPRKTNEIAPARSPLRPDGTGATFPVRYGFFTVALSEEAYERQYQIAAVATGTWGDNANEAYPVLFVGDWFENEPVPNPLPGADEDFDKYGPYYRADNRADAFLLPGSNNPLTAQLIAPAAAGESVDTLMAGDIIDGAYNLSLKDYISKEKSAVEATGNGNWQNHTNASALLPASDPPNQRSSQNRFVHVPGSDEATGPSEVRRFLPATSGYDFRTNLNARYTALWDTTTDDTNRTFKTMTNLIEDPDTHHLDNTTLPIVLNRPYASPAWLGLVPSGRRWRTIDTRLVDGNPMRNNPEDLLGLLMQNAMVDGCYARVNINTAAGMVTSGGAQVCESAVLRGLFDDVTAHRIVSAYLDTSRRGHVGWWNWDELLTEPCLQEYAKTGNADTENVGYFQAIKDPPDLDVTTVREDSGAGSYADGFLDDSDEKEEWFRRFSGLIDIRSTAFKVTAIGTQSIPGGTIAAESKIEAFIDRDRDTDGDGYQNCNIVEFRYVTESP